MSTPLYLPVDQVRPGDVLPEISRTPVAAVTVFPHESVRLVFEGGYITHRPYGGVDYGYPAVRVERPTPA